MNFSPIFYHNSRILGFGGGAPTRLAFNPSLVDEDLDVTGDQKCIKQRNIRDYFSSARASTSAVTASNVTGDDNQRDLVLQNTTDPDAIDAQAGTGHEASSSQSSPSQAVLAEGLGVAAPKKRSRVTHVSRPRKKKAPAPQQPEGVRLIAAFFGRKQQTSSEKTDELDVEM